jgi:hypothetical protein
VDKRLMKQATVAFLAFVMFVGIVYAVYTYIYSNVVSVPSSAIVLTYTPSSIGINQNLTLIATVTKNGLPVNGATVEFGDNCSVLSGYGDINWNTDLNYIGSSTTNSSGIAILTYTVTYTPPFSDGYRFVARCLTP